MLNKFRFISAIILTDALFMDSVEKENSTDLAHFLEMEVVRSELAVGGRFWERMEAGLSERIFSFVTVLSTCCSRAHLQHGRGGGGGGGGRGERVVSYIYSTMKRMGKYREATLSRTPWELSISLKKTREVPKLCKII